MRAAAHGAQSGERLEQLRLTVALDAGDAEDLARRDGEAHAVHRGEAARVIDDEIAHVEQRLATAADAARSRPVARSSAT